MWRPFQSIPASAWEARIDDLMLEQARMPDYGHRFELFSEVQHILAEEVPCIPLVNRNILMAKRRTLQNVRVASVFPYALSNIRQIYFAQE
jgi:ABC-type transport system substrate-binding protein